MAEEDQRDAREADVAGGDRREAERGEGSNDSRHKQMDSCVCSEGIRFLEAPWRTVPVSVRTTPVVGEAGQWSARSAPANPGTSGAEPAASRRGLASKQMAGSSGGQVIRRPTRRVDFGDEFG